MMRLPVLDAIGTTFYCPFTLAHLARAAAAIRARPAADILRRGSIVPRVLFTPLSALIAVSRAFTCCAALSRSAFNCAIMSMCSSPGEDCNRRSATQEALLESAPAYNFPRVVKCYGESAHLGVGPTPNWLDLFPVWLDVSSSVTS